MKLLSLVLLFISFFTYAQDRDLSNRDLLKSVDSAINNYQFEKALKLLVAVDDSANLELLQRKALCYSRLGNFQEAILSYEVIIKIDSTNRNALNQLGQLYTRTAQFDLAKGIYLALISEDTTNSFYFKQYASLLNQTNYVMLAIAYYLKVIELNPYDVEAYTAVSNLLLDADQFEVVDSLLTQAFKFTQNAPLKLLFTKAQFGQKKYIDVIETINEMLLTSDTTATMARLLGISYFQKNRYELAIPCMNFLLKAGVQADWIYYYLGTSYHQLKKLDKAIFFLDKAIEAGISDNISTYYTQYASTYEERKDFKNAIRYYKAAYQNSKSAILLYQIARSYDIFYKDKAQAISYYKRYLSTDDTIKIAREYSKQRVNQLSDF